MRIERDQWRSLLMIGGLIGVLVGGLLLPHYLRETRLHARLLAAEIRIRAEHQNTHALGQLTAELIDLRQIAGGGHKRLAQEGELAELLRQIAGALQEQQVVDLEIQTQAALHGDDYSMIPASLRFKGSFAAVNIFLRRIEGMGRLTRVTKLQMETPRGGAPGALSVRVELAMYLQPPEPPEPVEVKKP